MKKIYVFGNGNISWDNFHRFYIEPIKECNLSECEFLIGDFTGTDTLMMEFLKDKTSNVTILSYRRETKIFCKYIQLPGGKLENNWRISNG
ncbi:hypothetical protein ACR1PO_09135 [Chryseobacterium sp. RRHN12]|uniref:hypothetical protein n=1 Tax=Chryseobacterium sp. RRHN12 TaxID=3437884 RepID=UPI003D9B191C